MKPFRMFKPGDLLTIGFNQQWMVSGSYCGALNQQNLIGVEVVSQSAGTAHGFTVGEMYVPEEFLYGLCEAGLLTHFTRYETGQSGFQDRRVHG